MTRLVLFLLRLMALALSYTLSCAVAAAAITFVIFLGQDIGWLAFAPERDPAELVLTWASASAFFGTVWFTILPGAFWPAVVVFAVQEGARLRSLLSHLLGGAAIAVAAVVLTIGMGAGPDAPSGLDGGAWLTVLTAGFFGGAAHWLLAGHRAGRWLGPDRPDPVVE
ncbi:MAG: hypothetical protein AAGK38_01360 [Pseudomonadota bacterium]